MIDGKILEVYFLRILLTDNELIITGNEQMEKRFRFTVLAPYFVHLFTNQIAIP